MSNITKTAMITVCGRPNVGKSSLTNALVGEKVAIVSNKAQTTRNRIYGIVNREDTQYILLDTPGLHKPKSALGDYMVKVVTSSLSDVDCALLLVEPIPHEQMQASSPQIPRTTPSRQAISTLSAYRNHKFRRKMVPSFSKTELPFRK